ncbi:sulfate transporter N-terminal domain with GLY motif-domain-containing protein [Corynascus novoguineensis]|uniref:Sulfate transporter N-terminal domain with GLY motif-domain-containing protein n=1 Tax=Corynascus novoguineensis TaxID=1126955 RepID=A0AAN7CM49_9PEZI|nr:sulfate transporter N-terminal domain with GLY motif-domain-containing protein [Corynascus novoguineensis]
MQLLDRIKESISTDYTWKRARWFAVAGARALPGAAAEYVTEKLPIVGWLSQYRPRWLINDVIAGLTIGLMLITQGLLYARIATIPVQYGLLFCWFPPMLYAVMGTTKNLPTGPTSLIGLLTAEIIKYLQGEIWSAQEIASAVATMIGIYGLVIGLLKLGFLLDFISLPILSGFISAVAITIILNQMSSLLGEPNVRDGTANQIHDIFQQLPQANRYACAHAGPSSARQYQSELDAALDDSHNYPSSVPPGALVFRLNDSLFFPNSYRVKSLVMDTIKTRHSPALSSTENPEAAALERNWASAVREQRVAKLRRREGIAEIHPIRLVVVDFQRVNHVGATTCAHIEELFSEIRAYGSRAVRSASRACPHYVRRRFERVGWRMIIISGGGCSNDETREEGLVDGSQLVVQAHRNAVSAINAPGQGQHNSSQAQVESERDEKNGRIHRRAF